MRSNNTTFVRCRWFVVGVTLLVSGALPLWAQATWTPRMVDTTANLWAATNGDGVMVVVGEGGTILTSADGGATWTRRESGTTAWLTSVTYATALKRYFTVGEGGAIHSSADAIVWLRESSPAGVRLNGVGEVDGVIYAVGEAGAGCLVRDAAGKWSRADAGWGDRWVKRAANLGSAVLGQSAAFFQSVTSTGNVVSWQSVPLPSVGDLEDGATGAPPGTPDLGQSTVLVGAGGMILQTEKNGSWISRPSGTSEVLRGVCWKTGATIRVITNTVNVRLGEYFAVGTRGTVLRSRDGTEWTADRLPSGNNLNAVFVNGETVIAVGDRGTIWQIGGSAAAPDLAIRPDAGATAIVGVTGTGHLTYYWLRGAIPVSFSGQVATDLTVPLSNLEAGSEIHLVIANAFGARTPVLPPIRSFHNLSARAAVGAGEQTLIGGISIAPGADRTLLIRAVGPTLANFGLGAPLARPRLTVYSGANVLATNSSWSTAANAVTVGAVARTAGAFSLPEGSADAALLITLAPGNYTAQVTSADGGFGTALLEIYDASPAAYSHLKNLSTRAEVRSGDGVLIGGLVVDGSLKQRVLLRAAGPALAAFGLQGGLAQPKITVFRGNTLIATAGAWSTAANAPALATAAQTVGAFNFPSGSADAAVLIELEPGAYTLQVTGADGGTGIALVEAYRMP